MMTSATTGELPAPHGLAARRLAAAFDEAGISAGVREDLDAFGASTSVLAQSPGASGRDSAPVHVLVASDYVWHIPGRDHAHQVSLHAPADDVVEMVALCLAGRCTQIDEVGADDG